MKKILVFLLSFTLVFNVFSFPVMASTPGQDIGLLDQLLDEFFVKYADRDYNSAIRALYNLYNLYVNNPNDEDVKRGYIDAYTVFVPAIIKANVGIYAGKSDAQIREMAQKAFEQSVFYNNPIHDVSYFLAVNSTVTRQDITLNNDAVSMLQGYKDSIEDGTGAFDPTLFKGYRNYYFASPDLLPAQAFSDPLVYKAIQAIIRNNPEYYFYYTVYNGQTFLFFTSLKPYGVVSTSNDAVLAGSNYTEYWSTNFYSYPSASAGSIGLIVQNGKLNGYINCYNYSALSNDPFIISDKIADKYNGDVNTYLWADGLGGLSFSSLRSFSSVDLMENINQNNVNGGTLAYSFYNARASEVPVFTSLAALKKGTVGATPINYGSNYDPNSSVSPTVTVNNIIDNLPSGDTGSDDNNNNNNNNNNNGGGSIWDRLGDLITNVFDVLASLIAGLIDGIAQILPTISNLFSGLKDLANNGFVDLLTSFFPFLPPEWFSVIGLAIGLVLLIFIVRVFKG